MSVSCANCHAALPRYEDRGPEWKGCPNCLRIKKADEVNAKLLEVITELLAWLKARNRPKTPSELLDEAEGKYRG